MGNWGGAGEECGKEGRTKGSREEGGGWEGERAGGCRLCGVSLGPLSSYPVMLCSVGQVLSSYASHQRIRWETEKKKKRKKVRHSYTRESARTQYSERHRQRWEGHRERAVGSEPSWRVNERAVWDSTDTSVMCWLSWHNIRDVFETNTVTGFTGFQTVGLFRKVWLSLLATRTSLQATQHLTRNMQHEVLSFNIT